MSEQSGQGGGLGGLLNHPLLVGLGRRMSQRGIQTIVLPIGLLLIIFLLLIPLPSFLLDFALAISLTLSILILLVVVMVRSPLELTSFPAILLIATMLRLGLNVASTRLILTDGHQGPHAAGQIIESFARLMAGGNFVTGIIIFSILVIINFIVITRGAGRIAEVAARFTLDSLPGKQMSIDSDLNSGFIDEEAARKRRQSLEAESSFFGSMDGASKFVRGDAIAGLMITFINIIGGFIIGVAQIGLSAGEAAQNYTLLTIGDGLVSQVPALLVSVAAGMLVTSASDSSQTTQTAVFNQLSSEPKALYIASALMFLISVLPGLPIVPFFLLAVGLAATGIIVSRRQRAAEFPDAVAGNIETTAGKEAATTEDDQESVAQALRIDQIRVEMGYGLLSLIRDNHDQQLTAQIRSIRRTVANEYGFVMPSVRIQDNVQVQPNAYQILIKDVIAGQGVLRPNMLLVMDPRGDPVDLKGEDTTEPIFGMPARWISENLREEAQFRGLTVVNTANVISTHLTEIIKEHMPELLSYSETRKLLESMPAEQKKLLDDLVPAHLSYSTIQRVLQRLLEERLSVRDLSTITEALSEIAPSVRALTWLVEHVRSRLARQICDAVSDENNTLNLITLAPEWEQKFLECLSGEGDDRHLNMPPSDLHNFVTKLRQIISRKGEGVEGLALLVSASIRPWVYQVVARSRIPAAVLSRAEITTKIRIQTLGTITAGAADASGKTPRGRDSRSPASA